MVSSVREMGNEQHLEAERVLLPQPQFIGFGQRKYSMYLAFQYILYEQVVGGVMLNKQSNTSNFDKSMKLDTMIEHVMTSQNFKGDTCESHVNADVSNFYVQFLSLFKHDLYIIGKSGQILNKKYIRNKG